MKIRLKVKIGVGLLFGLFLATLEVQGATVEYELTIAHQEVNFTGKPARAMTINGGIPGPTLRFKEGDTARIHVHNRMSVETSIHWHGLLVPPAMDGVPYISFPPIRPGTTFTYEFLIRQSGTYWYHSHSSLQEQSGVYGSIVIEPLHGHSQADRDYVILLSDWTDENPNTVNRTLKRGSEWYGLEKGSSQSILGAARLGMLGDYFKRELQRMPAMDIADVAYDRFWANGRPEFTLHGEPEETIRLRIIDGSATTYFHVEFSGGPMTIISADGQDVEPVKESCFLIGVAETYDVLIRIPGPGAYEFRATAHDGSGYASVWVGSGKRHPASDVPKPNLYHAMGRLSLKQIFSLTPAGAMGMPDRDVRAGKFDRPGMMGMGPMDMGKMKEMDHSPHAPKAPSSGMEHGISSGHAPETPSGQMDHAGHSSKVMDHTDQAEKTRRTRERSGRRFGTDFRPLAADVSSSGNLAMDGMDPSRPWPPYAKLRATRSTAFPKDRPVRDIRLTLDGDMERYVWFLNNKALSESDSIRIREGEVARFILINRTMMHHPMHLHGHFFRVVNGQGDYAPLKHTVDVAPMSTTVIEFDANEVGDWFFHCHLLYHMKSGMARVVQYEGFNPGPQVSAIRPRLYKETWYVWGEAEILSSMTEGFVTLADTRNNLTLEWEAGWQKVDKNEWEVLFTWDRYINRFFSVFAGANFGNEIKRNRGVVGVHILLPFNLEARALVGTDRKARFNLGRSFELTPRLSLFGEAQYDTYNRWDGKVGLSYLVHKHFSLIGQWSPDFGFGAGLRIRF